MLISTSSLISQVNRIVSRSKSTLPIWMQKKGSRGSQIRRRNKLTPKEDCPWMTTPSKMRISRRDIRNLWKWKKMDNSIFRSSRCGSQMMSFFSKEQESRSNPRSLPTNRRIERSWASQVENSWNAVKPTNQMNFRKSWKNDRVMLTNLRRKMVRLPGIGQERAHIKPSNLKSPIYKRQPCRKSRMRRTSFPKDSGRINRPSPNGLTHQLRKSALPIPN